MKRMALLAILILFPTSLFAQMMNSPVPDGKSRYSVSASSSYQFKAGMDGGGDVSVARYGVSVGSRLPVYEQTGLGVSLNYLREEYDFSGPNAFPVEKPWSGINHLGLRAGLGYRLNSEWLIGGGPVVQSAGENGAKFEDTLMYGGILYTMYRANPDLMIGFGAGVFYRLEETRIFPALLISWKINDQLRLGNSYALGLAGPAGIELAYKIDDVWETAVGAGGRSSRFRLDRNGPTPGGIGENSGWPAYVRLSRKLGSVVSLDLYGGAAFRGKLRLEDSKGNEIRSIDYNTAPILGFNLRANF